MRCHITALEPDDLPISELPNYPPLELTMVIIPTSSPPFISNRLDDFEGIELRGPKNSFPTPNSHCVFAKNILEAGARHCDALYLHQIAHL